jgi:hypothetical protein
VTIYKSIGKTSYVDEDGDYRADESWGAVTISGEESVQTFRAILDNTDRDGFLQREYGSFFTADRGPKDAIEIHELSIDVSNKVEIISAGKAYNYRNKGIEYANFDLATLGLTDTNGDALFAAGTTAADLADAADSKEDFVADFGAIVAGMDGDQVAKGNLKAGAIYDILVDYGAALAAESTVGNTVGGDIAAIVVYETDENGDATTVVDAAATAAAQTAAYAAVSYQSAKDTIKVAGVVIGLPTLEITTTASSKYVGIEGDGSANSGCNFIRIDKEANTMAILGGTLEIAAH